MWKKGIIIIAIIILNISICLIYFINKEKKVDCSSDDFNSMNNTEFNNEIIEELDENTTQENSIREQEIAKTNKIENNQIKVENSINTTSKNEVKQNNQRESTGDKKQNTNKENLKENTENKEQDNTSNKEQGDKKDDSKQNNNEVEKKPTNPDLSLKHYTKYNLTKTTHAVNYLNAKIQKLDGYERWGGNAIAVTTKPCKDWFSYSYDEKLNGLATIGSTIKIYIEDEFTYNFQGTQTYLYDTKAYIYTE